MAIPGRDFLGLGRAGKLSLYPAELKDRGIREAGSIPPRNGA